MVIKPWLGSLFEYLQFNFKQLNFKSSIKTGALKLFAKFYRIKNWILFKVN